MQVVRSNGVSCLKSDIQGKKRRHLIKHVPENILLILIASNPKTPAENIRQGKFKN